MHVYDLKAYVLLLVIRPSYVDVIPGSPLDALRKEQANIGTGFHFTLPHLIIITHTLHHNTTLRHTHIIDNFSYLQFNIILQYGLSKWRRN